MDPKILMIINKTENPCWIFISWVDFDWRSQMIMQSGSPAINMKVLILPIIGCCTFACLHTKPVEYSHSKAQYNGAKCFFEVPFKFSNTVCTPS